MEKTFKISINVIRNILHMGVGRAFDNLATRDSAMNMIQGTIHYY